MAVAMSATELVAASILLGFAVIVVVAAWLPKR
jgi:hypothetical protein